MNLPIEIINKILILRPTHPVAKLSFCHIKDYNKFGDNLSKLGYTNSPFRVHMKCKFINRMIDKHRDYFEYTYRYEGTARFPNYRLTYSHN